MEKEFTWDGVTHSIQALTLKNAKEYFAVEAMLKSEDDREKQIDLCIRLLSVLGCPEVVIDTLPVDKFEECLTAVGAIHWGTGGGDEGNAGGDELNH